jgi:hypothetical protein
VVDVLEIGDKVQVKLSKDWVMIINIGKEFGETLYKCRTKDYREIWFNEFELEDI